MSWALSCLTLRRHYDEVALYTDSVGKHVLIDLLHLPYTEVNVVFDDFKCLPHHWALAKVYTYSLQKKPFIHVDGDVYLPNGIPEEIAKKPVIIQNREIGTKYYKGMIQLGSSTMTLPKTGKVKVELVILYTVDSGVGITPGSIEKITLFQN